MKYLIVFSLTILSLMHLSFAGEDFYKILGVEKTATVKEIRIAFKRKALVHHPDKNRDDPNAHSKFVKMNRAYEVLKDEELRKIYNERGEQGLKDKDTYGNDYQNWSFYKNDFGIYDEDKEIMTMNRDDFEQLVQGTDDIWFVNFYSPQCSHCHELAPTWREVAKEMEGVVKIAAINCREEHDLCQSQPFQQFPSIMQFPKVEKYWGEKTKEDIVNFMLKVSKAEVEDIVDADQTISGQLLITYCGNEDCLSRITLLKISAAFKAGITVGSVDCEFQDDICVQHNHLQGTYYYPNGLDGGNEMEITGLQTREVISQLMKTLPDIKPASPEELESLLAAVGDENRAGADGFNSDYLLMFTENEDYDPEIRKLSAMIQSDVMLRRLSCENRREHCKLLGAGKLYPGFTLFRTSVQDNDRKYGRRTADDVASFTKTASVSSLRGVNARHDDARKLPQWVTRDKRITFVLFMTSSCESCLKVMAEFRKSSMQHQLGVNFAFVDCDVEDELCSSYDITNHPTIILFNGTKAIPYNGEQKENMLIQFVEDLLNPPIVILEPSTFDDVVFHRATDHMVLVGFFMPTCEPCKRLAPEFRSVAKMYEGDNIVTVASIDCQAYRHVCAAQGVRGYPKIRAYKGTSRNKFEEFESWQQNDVTIYSWSSNFIPKISVEMDRAKFNSLIIDGSKQKYWLVDFYLSGCYPCQRFAPRFRSMAKKLHAKSIRTGQVDCNHNGDICQKSVIQNYPTLMLFIHDTNKFRSQRFQGVHIDADMSNDDIISEVRRLVGQARKIQQKDEL